MSTIRRQSIISSGVVYFGIALGALNTYLLVKWVTPAQYGLLGMFFAIGTIIYSLSNLGMFSYIGKFYPYYNDYLPPEKNDMMTWVLLGGLVGFIVVVVIGISFKPEVIRYYAHNSAELVHYYFWIFPFGLGITLFSLLEAYAWQFHRSILTNYLREVQWRLFTLLLLILLFFGVLPNFDIFIKAYAFTYPLLALFLLLYLIRLRKLHLTFKISRVTTRLFRFIYPVTLTAWSGGILFNTAFFFAQLVIAAVLPHGLAYVGIYTLATYIGSLIQAPQRVVLAAAIGPISRAWKDYDLGRIQRIYAQSSINQLIFSTAVFLLIWLNFTDGVITFHLKKEYLEAQYIFLFIGLTRIVDMGTGVNTQIIATSMYWRVDFIAGVILLTFTLPLNYLLAKTLGVTGPAIADLITFTIYNSIRSGFLYIKFRMQPFTVRTLYTLILGLACYLICQFAFGNRHGLPWLFIRSLSFLALYVGGALALKLSEDTIPVWHTLKKRMGFIR